MLTKDQISKIKWYKQSGAAVPCITGTQIATKMLKDGDLVEVDAFTGLVRIIKRS